MNLKITSHPHTIRFPDDLYWKIKLIADKNNRTFNGEVINLLEIGYALVLRARQAQDEVLEQAVEEIKKSQ